MGWVAALATVLGGALSGGGSLLGGSQAGQAGNVHDQPLSGFTPNADPLLQALQAMGLLSQGAPTQDFLSRGGPLSQLTNTIQQSGKKGRDLRLVNEGIAIIRALEKRARDSGVPADQIASVVADEFRRLTFGTKEEVERTGDKQADREAIRAAEDEDARFREEIGDLIGVRNLSHFGRTARDFAQIIGTQGYGNLEELLQAEQDFQAQAAPLVERLNALSGQVFGGREAAQQAIARLQGDFPAPTASDLRGVIGQEEEALLAALNLNMGDERQALLEAANTGGFNPAAGLGRIGERGLVMRRQIPNDAISRAVALLAGQQGLSAGALSALQGSVGLQDQTSLAAAGVGNQANLSAAQLAAQQAQAFANLATQAQLQKAGFTQQGFSDFGNAFGSLGEMYYNTQQNNANNASTMALADAIRNSSNNPGTGSGG